MITALFALILASCLGADQTPQARDVNFTAVCDGTTQHYVMLRPPGFTNDRSHDVLIALHGHGSDRWQFATKQYEQCKAARDVAAENGMLYVSPDYRAKTSWMGPKAEADVVQIIGDLRREYRVGKVYICGGSMGGSSSLTFAALHPDLVSGVASMNGTANHLEYDKFQDAISESFGGTKAAIPEEYKRRSAEYWPERFTMPVGIAAGAKDTLVPPGSVVRLAGVLEKMKRPVLLIYRENGGHDTNYADTRRVLEFAIGKAKATTTPAAIVPATAPASAPATRPTSQPAAHVPKTLDEAVAWLEVKSFEMIRACKHPMANGTVAFPPQVGSGYEAFWLRDYAYMLEGNVRAFSFQELRDSCRTFISAQRGDGAMVDCVRYNGKPIYKPGFGTMGDNPVADGSQFAVDVAYHTFRRTGDVNLLRQIIDPLIKAMQAVPLNPATGLVHIRPGGYDRCGYGFADSVRKQGDELFCSLLYVQAARQLGELLTAVDRTQDAEKWSAQAEALVERIRQVFWDDGVGLFRAATVQCREHDIWGSAFAVWLGVADDHQARRIADYFKVHYRELVKNGQVRHTPGGVYWEVAGSRDKYQNGAYWATPVGWFVYTLDLVDARLADATVVDMVRDFIVRSDVNECINDGYRNVANYVVSAVLPLDGIRAMQARRSRLARATTGR